MEHVTWNMDKVPRNEHGQFYSGYIHPLKGKKRGESPKKIKIEPELLESLYWGNQLGTVEIAELFNCEYKVIWRRMKEHNIPFRNNRENQKVRDFQYSEEQLKRIRTMAIGYKMSEKVRKQMSGKNHWNWKGGITKEHNKYRNLREWKEWRSLIFNRDTFTCQFCNQRGGNIEPHHIFPKSKYPKEIFDINNGITLCTDCHNLTKGKEDEFIDFSLNLLDGGVV